MSAHLTSYVIWMAWGLSWIAAALMGNRAGKAKQESRSIAYRAPALVGFVLLFVISLAVDSEWMRLWNVDVLAQWTLVATQIVALAFAWWARVHLGRLWASSVSRQEGHTVVETGPYAIVRHPIYTGIIAASAAKIGRAHV